MQLLIVAATLIEIQPLLSNNIHTQTSYNTYCFKIGNHNVTLLITGVGTLQTSYSLTSHLSIHKYDNALNMGICGAFNRSIMLGSVVNVRKDRLGDYGVEDGDIFKDAFELGLENIVAPFKENGLLYSSWHFSIQRTLKSVTGITVNTVHGNETSITKIIDKYNPDVESMEGAAFYFVCAKFQLPAAQVRGVSNYIERRNKDNWRIKEAIENCCICIEMILLN